MTRRWTRNQLTADTGWTPGALYPTPVPSGEWGPPVGTDGRSDLTRVDREPEHDFDWAAQMLYGAYTQVEVEVEEQDPDRCPRCGEYMDQLTGGEKTPTTCWDLFIDSALS